MNQVLIEGDTYRPYMLCVASLLPEWLEAVETLKPGPKLCYARLARYQGKEGGSFPSLRTLAASLGTNERQVQRWIAELKKEKLIAAKQRGLGQTNVYTFLVHPFMDGAKDAKGGVLEVTRREDPSGQISPVSKDDHGVVDLPDVVNIRESVEEDHGRKPDRGESPEGEAGRSANLKGDASDVLTAIEKDHESREPKFPELYGIVTGAVINGGASRDQRIKKESRLLLEQLGASDDSFSRVEWSQVLDEVVGNKRYLVSVIEQILDLTRGPK